MCFLHPLILSSTLNIIFVLCDSCIVLYKEMNTVETQGVTFQRNETCGAGLPAGVGVSPVQARSCAQKGSFELFEHLSLVITSSHANRQPAVCSHSGVQPLKVSTKSPFAQEFHLWSQPLKSELLKPVP